jgi:hypothetical protein
LVLIRLRRRTIWIGVALITLAALLVVWRSRWRLGGTALAIADPAVRSWLSDEVHRLSDSVYLVAASPLQVSPASHRITIDTITLATDPVANARRVSRLPTITLRFRHCVVDGIDLASMAAGHGLHATRAGCDSVWLSVNVPPHAGTTASTDSAGFLTLRGTLDLPRGVPDFRVDSIVFPHMQLALSSTTRDGRPMVIGLDHLAMQLDSMRYDPHEPVSRRRPFASRNARITLDHLDERHGHISHFGVVHLAADLSQGTLEADSVVFEPLAAHFADSLGFTALRLARAQAAGVDWRAFLTTGDIRIVTAQLDSATVSVTAASTSSGDANGTIGRTFATLERQVRVDSLRLTSLTVVERGSVKRDTAVTTVRQLVVAHLAVDNTPAAWTGSAPLGPVDLTVDGLMRVAGFNHLSAAHFDVNAANATLTADSVYAGPAGDDSTFKLHTPYRRDRRALGATRITVTGVDVPAFVLHAAYIARHADATGFSADVLTDQTIDTAPRPHPTHRSPQHLLDGIGAVIHFDTVTIAGRVTFRQRNRDAARPGVLAFDAVHGTITNLANAPTGPAGWPLRIVADAQMMGAGALHVTLDLPQETATLNGRWAATLGPMRATALNEFLEGSEGMSFTDGDVEPTAFDATITNGLALGTLAPRWRNLKIGMPTLAKDDHSLVGNLKRGMATIAANLFVIRGTNDTSTSGGPANGVIDHRWLATETLPEFLWRTLRDPLLGALKRSGSPP